jgi:DNA-binding NarL/FixJ family response regulator
MTKRVWIIEDNASYRETTLRGLKIFAPDREDQGFTRCEEALAQLQLDIVPDVILMDLGLPGMNGIDGIAAVKQQAPTVSILVLTVFEDDDKILNALRAGASGYMLKSEPIERVHESIESVLRGESPIHPRIAGRFLKLFAELAPARRDYGLNDRERAVLQCMARGLLRKQTAAELKLNPHTVDYLMRCIYRKLHVTGATAAVALAVKEQLLKDAD